MKRRFLSWLTCLAVGVGTVLLTAPADAQAPDVSELERITFIGPINVIPPVEPDIGLSRTMPAETQIRIDYAGLRFGSDDDGNTGWQFFARSRCIVWTGLERGNPVPYQRGVDAQPTSWRPLRDAPIHARASLTNIHSDETIFTKDITYDGDNMIEFAFPVIPNQTRILPGMYRIEVVVYLNRQQRGVMPLIWEEEEDVDDRGVFFFTRLDPRRISPVRNSAIVGVAGRNAGGAYVAMPMGGAASRSRALQQIARYDEFDRAFEELDHRIDELDEEELMLHQILQNEVDHLDEYRDYADDFREDLEEIRENEEAVRQAVSTYAQRMADEVEDFTLRLWQVSRQVYWMTNLCRPDFHLREGASGPNPMNPREHMEYTVPEMRERFGIGDGRFLDAAPEAMRDRRNPTEDDPITGAWHDEVVEGFEESPRRQWLNWLRDEWMPQINELREQYNRLFNDPEQGIEWGIRPDGETTYLVPLWSDLIGDLGAAIDHLTPMAQASANRLARIHTPEGEDTRYPFSSDRRGRRATPPPDNDRRHYGSINNALNRAILFFDITLAPEVEDEEELRELLERRSARSDSGRPDWYGIEGINPGEYDPRNKRYYRHSETMLVVPENVFEEMDEEEQEMFDPWCPLEEEFGH